MLLNRGKTFLTLKKKFLEKQTMSSSAGNFKAVPRDKLLGEQCELRAQREKVIRERKQFDVELKSLNMQVQKKVSGR